MSAGLRVARISFHIEAEPAVVQQSLFHLYKQVLCLMMNFERSVRKALSQPASDASPDAVSTKDASGRSLESGTNQSVVICQSIHGVSGAHHGS